jgi:acetyl-CoA decarbonylase/synthase complex subunit gamma
MNLASGKAELDSCPYVSDEAKEQLAEASAPPIRPVALGKGVRKTTAGGETVLFRHEKTFFNPTVLAATVSSDIAAADLDKTLKAYNAFQYERVGLNLRPELLAVKDAGKGADAFAAVAGKIAKESEFNLVLMSDDMAAMKAAVEAAGFKRPLLYAATKDNVDDMGALAKDNDLPLAVKADSVDALQSLTAKLTGMGLKDLVLDPGSREIKQALEDQVAIRRAALKASNKALGFPTITFPCEMASNLDMETLIASMFIAKYGGIVVLSGFTPESLFPLLLERLNIFTDPQRPMTVTEGIFEIGNPDENSPVLVTTNFALTYFIVSGEIEASKVPAWLLIKDSEGLSVLTAWAAGKFGGDDVGMFLKKSGIMDKVKHTELIIPGYAAAIAGDIEEELPGWTITVGPREAAHLAAFLKAK